MVKRLNKDMGGKEMKANIFSGTSFNISLFITGASLLTGCVVYKTVEPALPVSEVVQMSKNGVSSKNIINEMKQTHSVYMLKADELAKLSGQGVQDSVLNYMDRTRINEIRQRDYYSGYGPWGWYGPWYGGFGFGWPLGYWGWGFSPTIVIHGGGGYHYSGHAGFRR